MLGKSMMAAALALALALGASGCCDNSQQKDNSTIQYEG